MNKKTALPAGRPSTEPRYRSGAVARMAGMPVSTLRIWERRYQVAAPLLTPSGHRLYAAHDVQRLALIKRLVGLGHAIGTLARLGLPELEQLAALRAAAHPAPFPEQHRPGRCWSFVVVGSGLAQRMAPSLSRPSALTAGLEPVATCADLSQAEASADGVSAQLLLVQLATLHTESADRVLALARRIGAQRVIVLYRYGPDRAVQALQAAGAEARREPVSDAELVALWALAPGAEPGAVAPGLQLVEPAPPRRFSDEALADIAARSTAVACECPRHVADLVGQLASFEIYSAECLNRNADDAALHADLNRVAATARALFESALERVARAEGFELPAALRR
ncbi:MAG: MerR family transcriptional regulator [Burkholderiales bacterium]|nr:MerR family transcriptional regulator [Burkholderiales bacterium]